uniref:Membrane protein a149 n=1 Tax=Mastomys natalensis cytomegalovirus 2 TaxID=2973540 RepID=A0A9Y1IRJ6_9BETA|nr:membrane protein a149 [Mastomys natalensis cytomegalovirus 2]WEG69275.1 membrane protein a149 [Mastomys natalensis cytomegalovirus 2]WEG69414.1 membrane protein a149 [Mastomys natalensis cytomegalovirus 2]WEG69552.1 membrane protein a149 [Mastomys natalensis cytomegalovirus 2]WEG69690.1 membrane protein a149 [Mastomys natalensis cytomegalovirus 2]
MFGRAIANEHLRWIFLTVSLYLGLQKSESADVAVRNDAYSIIGKNTRALRENCLLCDWDKISYNITLSFISVLLIIITAYTTWMCIYREIRHILSYILNNVS